jgi:nucleoside-diphosphate kinase
MMKPDGVALGIEPILIYEIVRELRLRVVERRKMRLSRSVVAEHYAHHADKPFFPGLVAYMTSGKVVAMILEGEDAVAKVRAWVGVTDPTKAGEDTVRGRYGKKLPDGSIKNVVHASESARDAEAEIIRFFRPQDAWHIRLFRSLLPAKVAQRLGL